MKLKQTFLGKIKIFTDTQTGVLKVVGLKRKLRSKI